jgi:hypothetical protein
LRAAVAAGRLQEVNKWALRLKGNVIMLLLNFSPLAA